MTDEEVMGSILRLMHERRHDDLVPLTKTLGTLGVPQNVIRSGLRRLQEKGLVEWLDREVGGFGMGRITDHGIEVAGNSAKSPMPIVVPTPTFARQGPHLNQSQRDYLTKKLSSLGDEALEKALIAVNIAQSKVTLAGQLGNSRAYLLYNDAAFDVINETRLRMVKLAYHATNGHSDEAASCLDTAATGMIAIISDTLEKRFQQAARAYGDSPLVDQLRKKSLQRKDQTIDDFKHGMEGETPLSKQQTGNVFNVTQTNSPAGQIAIGNQNVQSIQQQTVALTAAIDELIASDKIENLNPDRKELLLTLADLARTELQKSSADVPKVKSWVERLSEIVKGAGLVAEAAKLGAALASWLSSLGL